MPDTISTLLYGSAIDITGLENSAREARAQLASIGDFATKTFDQNISRALANAVDPDDLATGVNRAKNLLNSIGVDANRSFEAALGRNASKKLLQPLIDESQTFAGKMKASFKEAFNVKNIALGAIGGIFAADLLSRAASGLFELGKKTVSIARDAEETRSKFNVLFGEMADDTRAWANTFADSVGRSRLETEDFLATIRAFLTPLGLGAEAADEMSKSLTSLAVDVASFNNAVDADVLRDFRSALSGEIEPVKKYGIVINEARVQQEAWRLGIAKTGQALTEQQKVQTRYRILLTDTVTAQGDAIRTADSLANQQKRLQANLTNLGETIGAAVVPALADMLSGFNAFITRITSDDLDKSIARMRELGAAAEDIAFFTMSKQLIDTQKEIRNANKELETLVRTANNLKLVTNEERESLEALALEVSKLSKTEEGRKSLKDRVTKLTEQQLEIEKRLFEETSKINDESSANITKDVLAQRQKLVSLRNQSEQLNRQLGIISSISVKTSEIEALDKTREALQKRISGETDKTLDASKKVTDEKQKQANQEKLISDLAKLTTKDLEDKLKVDKENAEVIKGILENRKKEEDITKRSLDFIKRTRSELALISASTGIERALLAVQQEAAARREEFAGRKQALVEVSNLEIAQIQQIIDERRKGLTELRSDLLKLTAADTFESRLAEIQREHQERIANLQAERDAVERNDKINAAQKRELFEIISGQIAEEQQIQAGKEQKVRDEIIKTNEELQKRFEIASAKTDFEAGLIALRQQFEEQIKGLKTVGKQREDDEKKINALARKEFKKSLEQFENGLDDLTKQRLKELLVKLKINLESEVNFEEFFAQLRKGLDEGLTKSGGQIFRERLAAIGKPFEDFELFLEDYGIKLDSEFFDLVSLLDKGTSKFIENLINFASSFKSGPVAILSASIPLIDGLIGGLFGDREKKRREALEEQERISEGARLALERFNKEIDETRKAAEKATIGFLADEYEKIIERIREITGLNRELTKEEFDRYRLLRIREQGLLADIERARDAGDLEWLLALEAELVTVQDELELIGGDLNHLTLSQLEALRELIEKQEIYNEALEEFGKFAPGFAGIMERLNRQFELFDINDPAKKLELFNKEIFEAFGVTLPNSVEDIDIFVRGLFDAFLEGGEVLSQFLQQNDLAGLSDLTAEEFLNLLTTIEGFADDLGGVADSLSDPFQRIKDELSLLFEIADIEDPARQLGILRTQLNRQFESLIPSDIPGLEDFIQGGLRALLAGGENFEAFLEQFGLEELSREQFQELLLNFEGLMDRMQDVVSEEFKDMIFDIGLSFDLLDINDPLKKLELLSKEVSKRFGAVIPQTQEAIDELLAQGTAALIAGGESLKTFLASINLEELTAEEFEELLKTLKNFADEATQQLEDATQTAEEITTSQVKSITFTQGNKLIDEVTTMRIILTQMLNGMLLPAGLNQANLAAALTGLNFGGVGASVSNNYFIIRNGTVTRVAENELDTVDRRLIENARRAAQAKGVN